MPRGEEIDEVRWVPGWDGILPECPPRPHLHGVWRLAEGATKWKDVSHNIATMPDKRPQLTAYLAEYERTHTQMDAYKKRKHAKRIKKHRNKIPKKQKKPTKVQKVDAAVQTNEEELLNQDFMDY
ncbi:uncharacterized protein LOC116604825 isoform X2 [Nematostella vectensis]|uniref:uncharacterized protein LOC116604825 isoform X2 n=1 Tax=Nematostella vectensis TaxID=45351 RepID=UPI001390030B|nr:uncharacterized protein LOC116604825 isoform X2 [Nematostella vectensis]